jgi:putative hemolysin
LHQIQEKSMLIFNLFILQQVSFFNYHHLSAGVFIGLILVVVLLLFSALISGSEVAFFSLNPTHLKELKELRFAADRSILTLLDNPKRLLANILIANNFVNVAAIILLSYLLNLLFNLGENPVFIFFIEVVFITSMLLLFGEILPKVLATHKPLTFARLMAGPMRFVAALMYPLTSLLVSSTSLIDRRIAKKSYNISMDELSQAIDLTTSGVSIEEVENETNILKGIAKFGDTDAREIMRSRIGITAVETDTSFEELLSLIYDSGFSRIPVYRESFDSITGILYIKDLLPYIDNTEFEWQSVIRPAYFVPESKKISDLLKDFQKRKMHMAIVVDEYGGTSGIVTLEDVIEEIVGDINDEFDTDSGDFVFSKIDQSNYLFDAKTSILDFCRITGVKESDLNEFRGDAETLAGLVLEYYGRIPGRNEEISIGSLKLKVESSDSRRIKLVKVSLKN